ncbi:hypothetical protein G6F68_016621 [Rhizopus microsporus]|nr:hypothetical protein G6F68_016621 [Rhizopus microsporus]
MVNCAAGHCAGPALFPRQSISSAFPGAHAMQKPAVTVMVKAARLAGNVLLRNINKLEALNVVQKGRMDYASEVDADAEKVIVKELKRAYPEYGIFGEEGGQLPAWRAALLRVDRAGRERRTDRCGHLRPAAQ